MAFALRAAVLVLSAFLASCASTSGVIPMGPDTYTVMGKSEFGSDRAKIAALEAANKFALGKGLHMIPVRENAAWELDFLGDRIATYEIVFRLVSADDPEYQRTNLRPVPDVVIEDDRSGSKPTPTDKYEELRTLKRLLEDGVITQEEFDKKKAEILARP